MTAAGDGVEALAAARRDPPAAIVSDVLMPKMDGFALCRAWMQDAALRPIPFIFYSATYARAEDEQFAMALGAVRYPIKPLEAEVFLRELRAMLQQWAGNSAAAPAPPLNDAAYYALHESVIARKLEAILLEARIMAVADVVEAMSSHRPYRPGLGIEAALAEIKRGSGTAYDADVADACLRLFREKHYQLPA